MKKTAAVINAAYKVSDTYEISVDYDGFNFLVIFGHHINGGFIAVVNHGICCEASSHDSINYNMERLNRAGMKKEHAREIAMSIAAYMSCRLQEDGKDVLC